MVHYRKRNTDSQLFIFYRFPGNARSSMGKDRNFKWKALKNVEFLWGWFRGHPAEVDYMSAEPTPDMRQAKCLRRRLPKAVVTGTCRLLLQTTNKKWNVFGLLVLQTHPVPNQPTAQQWSSWHLWLLGSSAPTVGKGHWRAGYVPRPPAGSSRRHCRT